MTSFEGLFYAAVPNKCASAAHAQARHGASDGASRPRRVPRGEYANLIKSAENVDMHLLVDKVASAVLESAPGRGAYTSHLVRILNAEGVVAVTYYLMWPESAARGAYAPGQVEAFQALLAKYGASVSFLL